MSPNPALLPVFRLAPQAPTDDFILKLTAHLDLSAIPPTRVGEFQIFRSESRRLDVNFATGDVWYADEARLWKMDFEHGVPPDAESPATTVPEQPQVFLDQAGLKPFIFEPPGIDSRVTPSARVDKLAVRTKRNPETGEFGERRPIKVDFHVSYVTELLVPDPSGTDSLWAPLVGAGVKRGMIFDPSSQMIGFHGATPRALEPPSWEPSVDKAESQQVLFSLFQHLPLHGIVQSKLAYEVDTRQNGPHLRPVWLHHASALVDGAPQDLPIVALPATVTASAGLTRVSLCPHVEIPTSSGTAGLSTGAWYIDASIGGENNAAGFLAGMAMNEWHIVANLGNDLAYKKHWLEHAAGGVEQTDLAFYAGHAGKEGWYFATPFVKEHRLCASDVSVSGDGIYGGNKLKWIAIAACGPLQDAIILPDGGDVFTRWADAFDGLHTLLGFGTTVGARCQGARFARLLQIEPVIKAWLRSALVGQLTETTAGSVRVGTMYAFTESLNNDPYEDFVGPNPKYAGSSNKPDTFTAIWAPA
jgi:Family of unknown function (DUF6345)